MSIQDWGAIGELVGAAAVIITLIYLAAQIRQNTRSLRNATSLSITQALGHINGRWAENPDGFAEIWLRGCADLKSLTPVEYERFSRHTFDLLNLAVYFDEVEKANLADVHMDWIGYLNFLFSSNPGLQEFFRDVEDIFVATSSRDLYDRIAAPSPVISSGTDKSLEE